MFNIVTHNGRITITSLKTGEHRVISVYTSKSGKNIGKRYVAIKKVESDTSHYPADHQFNYFRFAEVKDGKVVVFSRDPFFRTLGNMIAHPNQYTDKAKYQFEGKCRVCNRPLTHPDSILSGIGPHCAGKK